MSIATRRRGGPRELSMLSTIMTAPPECGAGSGGRGGGVRAGRLTQARPIPRQKLVQTVLWQVGDPGQDIGKPRAVT